MLTKVGYSNVTTPTPMVTDTNFHHVAVTKTGSAVTFYVDGLAQTVGAYDPGFVFNGTSAIGARGTDYATSFLGTIDEVSVYNRALSGSEVQSIYNAGSNGKCVVTVTSLCVTPPVGLVGWWPGEGNAFDVVGGNNAFQTNGITYAPGEVGEAFVFDGTTSSITVPGSASLNVQNLTIETWIFPPTSASAGRFLNMRMRPGRVH